MLCKSTREGVLCPGLTAKYRHGKSSAVNQWFWDQYLYPDLCTGRLLKSRHCILDYGCGYGDDVSWLRHRGLRVTGYEPYVTTSCFKRKPRGKYDVVYLIDVLCSLPPVLRRKPLIDAWSFVKPGGRLIVSSCDDAEGLEEMVSNGHARVWSDGVVKDTLDGWVFMSCLPSSTMLRLITANLADRVITAEHSILQNLNEISIANNVIVIVKGRKHEGKTHPRHCSPIRTQANAEQPHDKTPKASRRVRKALLSKRK